MSSPRARAVPAPLLELRDATVVRDGVPVLHVDSLALAEGERVAVLGPNGSGKSTLVALLTRDAYPLARDGAPPVLLRGRELWDLLEARSLFGVVTSARLSALFGFEADLEERDGAYRLW